MCSTHTFGKRHDLRTPSSLRSVNWRRIFTRRPPPPYFDPDSTRSWYKRFGKSVSYRKQADRNTHSRHAVSCTPSTSFNSLFTQYRHFADLGRLLPTGLRRGKSLRPRMHVVHYTRWQGTYGAPYSDRALRSSFEVRKRYTNAVLNDYIEVPLHQFIMPARVKFQHL